MPVLLSDVRFALRAMRKNAGLTVVAVVTLSLGIGATVAIFSILNAVLLRPLPYDHPESLVTVQETHPTISRLPIGVQDYGDMKNENKVFSDVAAYTFNGFRAFTLIGPGEPEQLSGVLITGNLFPLLGIKPLLGRNFSVQEESDDKTQSVMLSERIWRQRFSSDPGIIGHTVNLDGQGYTVVAVVAQRDEFPVGMDLWFPVSLIPAPQQTSRVTHALIAVGRLKPDVTLQQARTELNGIASRLQELYPATNNTIGFVLSPFNEQFVGSVRTALWILLGSVALVLLIACANVANLLLANGSVRVREIAVRSALGASRRRIVRQLLTESIMLSFTGAALGVILAYLTLPLLKSSLLASIARDVPRISDASVNLQVLGFSALAALLTGIIFGALPALQISKANVADALKQEAAASVGGGKGKLRRALVAVEVALSVIVLVGAGLLVRSFRKVLEVDPGLRTDHVLTAHILLPGTKYAQYPQVFEFYEQALAKIRAVPGVEWAATVSNPPLTPSINWTRFAISGEPTPEPGRFPVTQSRSVSPDYFEDMRIPLLKGRQFNDIDLHNFNTPPLIINATLAHRFFNGKDPVGRQILLGVMFPNPTAYTICGVVADSHDVGLDVPAEAQIFFPAFGGSETILIGAAVEPIGLVSAIRGAVFQVDPNQPIDNIQTLDTILAGSLARRRFATVMLGLFSGLALLLASVGLYGVVSYAVTQRRREIGLRVALGASSSRVVRMLLAQGMLPVWAGLAAGIAGALALTRLISTMLFGVTATDPVTFATMLAILAAVAALACYIPARRAASIDPAIALRYE